MAPREITKEKALEHLASLCSRSEQCESDLNRKMINWKLSPDDRKNLIQYLKENNYLDDQRFANSYANDKARFSFWGPYKIKMELVKKRISSPVISKAIENVEKNVWKEGLLKNAAAKSRNLDLTGDTGFENRQKLLRYLLGRGFPSALSSKAVNLMKQRQENNL